MGMSKSRKRSLVDDGSDAKSSGLLGKVVAGKIKNKLGLNNCRFCGSTGSVLNSEISIFFDSVGTRISEVFTMRAATGWVAAPSASSSRRGRCGPVLPGGKILIEDGCAVLLGRNVCSGFFNDEEATSARLRSVGEGKLSSVHLVSDVKVELDNRDVIVANPAATIADKLVRMAGPLVSHAHVIERPGVGSGVLFTLSCDGSGVISTAAKSWASAASPPIRLPDNVQLAIREDAVKTHILTVLAAANSDSGMSVKKYVILPRAFRMETGELSSFGRVRSTVVEAAFEKPLLSMFGVEKKPASPAVDRGSAKSSPNVSTATGSGAAPAVDSEQPELSKAVAEAKVDSSIPKKAAVDSPSAPAPAAAPATASSSDPAPAPTPSSSITLASGLSVNPEEVEKMLESSMGQAVSRVVVVGQGEACLACIVSLNARPEVWTNVLARYRFCVCNAAFQDTSLLADSAVEIAAKHGCTATSVKVQVVVLCMWYHVSSFTCL